MASFRDRISMVSPWVDPGNFYKFIVRFPEADRMDLCLQVANGLAYLHANNVIFGDMKAQNVLVGFDGIAMLTDFGLSVLDRSKMLFSTTENPGGGSTRWMLIGEHQAPELISGATGRSREADIYALGMTWIEFLTGEFPFPQSEDFQVIYMVTFIAIVDIVKQRIQYLESRLADVLRYGYIKEELMVDTNTEPSILREFAELRLKSRPASLPSSRSGAKTTLQSNEHLVFFIPNFTSKTGAQDTNCAKAPLNSLVQSCSRTVSAKQRGTEKQFSKRLQDQICHELEERIQLAHHWITTNLAPDAADTLNLVDKLKNIAPRMRAAVRLCLKAKCTRCLWLCLRPYGHSDWMHHCLTDHSCAFDCAVDTEHLGSKTCGLPPGHADAHLYVSTSRVLPLKMHTDTIAR
ncbi:hypothetical protein FRC12_002963 [Ceratobasidium sp. 428]|nr:hypothetical protein FRC12_002963 [Ceratobasidium sp. 428]